MDLPHNSIWTIYAGLSSTRRYHSNGISITFVVLKLSTDGHGCCMRLPSTCSWSRKSKRKTKIAGNSPWKRNFKCKDTWPTFISTGQTISKCVRKEKWNAYVIWGGRTVCILVVKQHLQEQETNKKYVETWFILVSSFSYFHDNS